MKKILFTLAVAIFLFGCGATAQAATLSIVTTAEFIKANQEFTLDIKLDTESANVNAVQATVQFPKDVLEAVRVDKTNSAFTFWLEEPTIDTAGSISFTTGSTSGLSGKSLQVLRIVFRMKGSGNAEVSLIDSAVTAADGAGTNVLFQSRGLKITATVTSLPGQEIPVEIPLVPKPAQITRTPVAAKKISNAPVVTVPFYPDQAIWHNLSDHFLAQWQLPADVAGVAAVINRDANFNPTISEGVFDNKMFPALDDGVNYLHVRFKNSLGWGTTAHYRIAIDTAPPLGFDIAVVEGNPSVAPNPTLAYKSGDQLSGLFRYALRINNHDTVFTNDSEQRLEILPPGRYPVRIAAQDNAGNSVETIIELEILPIASPILNSVNRDLFVGEGNLFVSGSSALDTTVALTLTNSKGSIVSDLVIVPDSTGAWSTNIDTPLKRGDYTLVIVARDVRGAMSYPVTETLTIKHRPLVTIFGIGISPLWFYTFTSLLLIGALLLGIFFEHYRRHWRSMRLFVLERDATNLINNIKEDVDIVAKGKASTATSRIKANLKKMEDYVVEAMGKINK